MADFYQKVATPQTQYRQQRQNVGPSVDVNAHAQAQNDYNNNIGNAIQNLIGAASSVNSIIKQNDKIAEQKMIAEHSLDAEAATYGVATHIHNTLKAQAEQEGKPLEDYTDTQIKEMSDKAVLSYTKTHNLSEKSYYPLMQKLMKHKQEAVVLNTLKTNEATTQNKRVNAMSRQFYSAYKAGATPKEMVDGIKSFIASSVGFEDKTSVDADGNTIVHKPQINMAPEQAQLIALQHLVEMGAVDKDPRAAEMINSPEFKEYYKGAKGYKALGNSVTLRVQSAINKEKQINFGKLEEFTYGGLEAMSFGSAEAAYQAIDGQVASMPKARRPSTKRIQQLKDHVAKSMVQKFNFDIVNDALKKGDFTAYERLQMPKKVKDQAYNEFFKKETGIHDTSAQGIMLTLNSGEADDTITSFLGNGFGAPKVLKDWANKTPTGELISSGRTIIDPNTGKEMPAPLRSALEMSAEKAKAIGHLSALTKGSTVGIHDIIDSKPYTKLIYAANLKRDIDAGLITNKEANETFRNYNNNLDKNVDGHGIYRSPKMLEVSRSEKYTKFRNDLAADAPYRWDDNTSQDFIRRQIDKNMSYALDITEDVDDAMDKAEESTMRSLKLTSNPDGSETVLPFEWKNEETDDMARVIDSMDDNKAVAAFKASAGYGTGKYFKEYDFKSSLSFKPSKSFESDNLMQVFYNGHPMLSMTYEDYTAKRDLMFAKNNAAAEDRNVQATQSAPRYTPNQPKQSSSNYGEIPIK